MGGCSTVPPDRHSGSLFAPGSCFRRAQYEISVLPTHDACVIDFMTQPEANSEVLCRMRQDLYAANFCLLGN